MLEEGDIVFKIDERKVCKVWMPNVIEGRISVQFLDTKWMYAWTPLYNLRPICRQAVLVRENNVGESL